MTVRFAPALVAACVLASPLAAQQLQGREGTRFTWSERVPAGQWLRIYGNNGRIQVTEATGDAAEVVGEKELRRGKPEDIAFEVLKTSDGITICAVIDRRQPSIIVMRFIAPRRKRGWNRCCGVTSPSSTPV